MNELRIEEVITKNDMRRVISAKLPLYLASGGQIARIPRMDANEMMKRQNKRSFYGYPNTGKKPPMKIAGVK